MAEIALGGPQNAILELAGPELIRQYLLAKQDSRHVVTDPTAPYYGIILNDQSLTPSAAPILGSTRFENWLRQSA